MGDVYSYDSAVSRNAEQGLGGTITALEGSLADLGGFVNSVCANWDGDEKEIYRGIQTQWDNASREVQQILTQIKKALGQTTESVETMRGRVRGTLEA